MESTTEPEKREVYVERDRTSHTWVWVLVAIIVLLLLFFVFGGGNLFGGASNTTNIQTPVGSGAAPSVGTGR